MSVAVWCLMEKHEKGYASGKERKGKVCIAIPVGTSQRTSTATRGRQPHQLDANQQHVPRVQCT
eukprot:1035711-Pelagomonas_calceolata.AAC.1